MKILLLLIPFLFIGCTKENTPSQPEQIIFTVNIENTKVSNLKDIKVMPYYPDSIKFAFTTTDTGKTTSYVINRHTPSWYFVCGFDAIKTDYSYTLVLKNEVYQDFFNDTQYVISKNYLDSLNIHYSDAVAYISISRSK